MGELLALLPSLPTLAQGGLLAGLLGVLLRVMYVERREHREELADRDARIATRNARIDELEEQARLRTREHEAEVDVERDKRRAAEDVAALAERTALAADRLRDAIDRES